MLSLPVLFHLCLVLFATATHCKKYVTAVSHSVSARVLPSVVIAYFPCAYE